MLPLIFVLAIRDCDSESEEMIIEGPTVIYPVKIVCLIFFNYQWIFLLCPFPLKQSYVRYVLHVKCMYHISDITDFALWPILLSSAIFWWVWGNPTKPLEIKLKTNWRVFLGCHISYVCITYYPILYIFFIWIASQGVNIFIVSFPTHAVLFQIAPRRNTKGHENIEKISILEWKDFAWGPFLRIKIKWKHEESSWNFFISWDHTLVHRYSKEREEKCNYTTPTAHWNHKFIQEATKISSSFLFRP